VEQAKKYILSEKVENYHHSQREYINDKKKYQRTN
jgi:hypothetical protein